MPEMPDFSSDAYVLQELEVGEAVDEVFGQQPAGPYPALLQRVHEKCTDRIGTLVLLGGAAVYQAVAAATQAIRNTRKK